MKNFLALLLLLGTAAPVLAQTSFPYDQSSQAHHHKHHHKHHRQNHQPPQ